MMKTSSELDENVGCSVEFEERLGMLKKISQHINAVMAAPATVCDGPPETVFSHSQGSGSGMLHLRCPAQPSTTVPGGGDEP